MSHFWHASCVPVVCRILLKILFAGQWLWVFAARCLYTISSTVVGVVVQALVESAVVLFDSLIDNYLVGGHI
jgi:hypothetical protein